VLSAIWQLDGKTTEPLRLADIAEAIPGENAGASDQPITAHFVGKVLRRLGLALYKRNGVAVLVPGQGKAPFIVVCQLWDQRSGQLTGQRDQGDQGAHKGYPGSG
jgi:hypothetical protein